MYNYQYYILFFFFIYIFNFFYNKFSREIYFFYINRNYVCNYFLFNKCKSINLNTCYIIHDKGNKERVLNLDKIKSQIDIDLKIHEGIFPNKGDWNNLYNKYSLLYPLLRTDDFRSHGCFLSHVTLLERIFDDEIDCALILEDNISIIRKIPNKMIVPKDFDIISLEHDRLGGVYYNSNFIRVTNGCGACGYIVNVRSIRKILNKLKETKLPIDLSYVDLSYNNILLFYNFRQNFVMRCKNICSIRNFY